MPLSPEMKLALIAAPVIALYWPTVPFRWFVTKRLFPDQASPVGGTQPGDEVDVDRGSGGGVVLANRIHAEIRYEEIAARYRDSIGNETRDDVEVDRRSGSGVVLANGGTVNVRCEEVVTRHRKSRDKGIRVR